MLQDNSFRWLQRFTPMASAASDPAREEALRKAITAHLHLPCGIIRGGWKWVDLGGRLTGC